VTITGTTDHDDVENLPPEWRTTYDTKQLIMVVWVALIVISIAVIVCLRSGKKSKAESVDV